MVEFAVDVEVPGEETMREDVEDVEDVEDAEDAEDAEGADVEGDAEVADVADVEAEVDYVDVVSILCYQLCISCVYNIRIDSLLLLFFKFCAARGRCNSSGSKKLNNSFSGK